MLCEISVSQYHTLYGSALISFYHFNFQHKGSCLIKDMQSISDILKSLNIKYL